MDQDQSQELRELVARCLDRIEHDGESALEEMCREHPEHADALRRRMEKLRSMGLVGGEQSPGEFPERLGDFRLLGPIGSGGMGVVYLAEQEGMGRRVALKLIRPEHLYFPGARERFQREVEAVARLRHPSIVPVYTVGEENGVPFLAMEYVEGKSLSEIIDALKDRRPEELTADDLIRVIRGPESGAPSGSGTSSVMRGRWVEVCFRVLREVALALQHAHQMGVLHRDIKPSNVMITPEGRVMLLDFGLAVSTGATRVTRSGALVGSLPYMASEQILGRTDDVGPGTDVYGLGVTLYELLTLNLPYSGESIDVLQRAILDGRPQTPSSRNPAVPWDAETVCLTAMDPDIRRRYTTTEELATDLGNVLDLRPIAARRPGAGLRIRRFTQRHPAAAVALLLGGVIALGGPSVVAFMERSRRLEVDALNVRLEEAVTEANHERERAEESFEDALEAVDFMLLEVGRSELADVPLMEGVRRRLLERALTFYRSFLEERGDRKEVRTRVAEGYFRVGRILKSLGRTDEARKHLEDAMARFEELAAGGADPVAELRWSRSVLELSAILRATGDLDGSVAQLERARTVLRKRIDRDDSDNLAWNELSRMLGIESENHAARGETDEAERLLRQAIAAAEKGVRADDEPGFLTLCNHWNAMGLLLMRQDASYPTREKEIEQAYRNVLDISRRLAEQSPEQVEVRFVRCVSLQNLAGHFRRLKRFDDAEQAYEEARAALELLAAQYPERVIARKELAYVLNNLGLLHELRKQWRKAEELYQLTAGQLEKLHRAVPDITEFTANLGTVWMNLANMALQGGDRAAESERLLRARDYLEQAVRESPDNNAFRMTLFNALAGLVTSLNAQGRHAAASEVAVVCGDALPKSWLHQVKGAIYVARCADVARTDPNLTEEQREERRRIYAEQGVSCLRRAVDLGFTNTQDLPWHEDFEPFHDTAAFEGLLSDLGLAEDEE